MYNLTLDMIRVLRKRNGDTLDQLAKKLKTSPFKLRMVETGKRSPTVDELLAICDAYDAPLDIFIQEVKRLPGRPKTKKLPWADDEGFFDPAKYMAAGCPPYDICDYKIRLTERKPK